MALQPGTDLTTVRPPTAGTVAIFIQAPTQDPHGSYSSTSLVCWLQLCLVHTIIRHCCEFSADYKCPISSRQLISMLLCVPPIQLLWYTIHHLTRRRETAQHVLKIQPASSALFQRSAIPQSNGQYHMLDFLQNRSGQHKLAHVVLSCLLCTLISPTNQSPCISCVYDLQLDHTYYE